MMEYKSVTLEMKDLDKGSRTAIIAHAVYNNIDRAKDISRKGMFTKSWNESKEDINLYLNHNDEQSPGKVLDVYEDDGKAYTKAWLGTHTLGNDTLIMMDEGIIKKASFGYITVQSNPVNIKGQKVRELKEVKHFETSLLTKIPCNPAAGVTKVYKAFDPLELKELTDRLITMESFCRSTKASDECIVNVLNEIQEIKSLLLKYDTDSTLLIEEPDSSKNAEELILELKKFNQLFKHN